MQAISRHTLARALAGILAVTAGSASVAQTFPDWMSPTSTSLGGQDAFQKARQVRATVFLVPANLIEQTPDPAYFRLKDRPGGFNAFAGLPIAPTTQFYGEARMAAYGRTGYLVAPDVIATASHGQFDANAFVVLIDMWPQYNSVTGVWDPPDFDHIPAANVILPHATDSVLVDSKSDIPPGVDARGDFAAFRLATPITDRPFLRLRRSGNPEFGDRFMFTAYPERMTLKASKNVGFLGMAEIDSRTLPTFTNYALLEGSSGGPVYNLSSGYVEAAVGSPHAYGCTMPTFDSLLNYYVVSNVCPESPSYLFTGMPGPLWPPYNVLDFGSIKDLSQHLTPTELLVSPLGTVTQVIALGGTPATTTFPYTLKVAAGAPAAVAYTASVEAPPVGQPNLLTMPALSGSILPGNQETPTATLSAAGITSCGVYEQSLVFPNVSHNMVDRVKHRLEVGLTDYTIEAPVLDRFQGIVGPYLPTQIQYTIKNPRPTATQVKVSNSTNWLRIDGLAVPGSGTLDVTYNLAAKGVPGDSAVVTITVDATNANALSVAEHSATLTFANLGTCANPSAAVTRAQAVVLDKRELAIVADVGLLVPESSVGVPLTSTINVPEAFCVSNIEFSAGFLELASAYGNSNFSAWKADLDLYLTNPTGQRVRIWDRRTTPPDWPYVSGNYYGDPIQIVRLNSTDRPPPSGVTLDAFVNRAAAGTWTLEAFDVIVNSRRGLETSWQLKLKGTPGACPP